MGHLCEEIHLGAPTSAREGAPRGEVGEAQRPRPRPALPAVRARGCRAPAAAGPARLLPTRSFRSFPGGFPEVDGDPAACCGKLCLSLAVGFFI